MDFLQLQCDPQSDLKYLKENLNQRFVSLLSSKYSGVLSETKAIKKNPEMSQICPTRLSLFVGAKHVLA